MQSKQSTDKAIAFKHYFPTFMPLLESAKKTFNYKSNYFEEVALFFKAHQAKLLELLRHDACKFMLKEWMILESHQKGSIVVHTLYVVTMIFLDQNFVNLPPLHQEILLWSAFLHDICKRGRPVMLGKDHVHPFNSSVAMLRIFSQLGFINVKEHELNEVCLAIQTSFVSVELPQAYKQCCDQIHDHSKIHTFMPQIRKICSCRFSYSVFVFICFHQSITVIKHFPHQSVLSEAQIVEIFDEEMMELFKYLMSYDSLSYTFMQPDTSCKNKQEVYETLTAWQKKIIKARKMPNDSQQ